MSQYAQWGEGLSLRVRASVLSRRRPWPAALAFGVAFAGTVAVAMLQGEKLFYNDAAHYWLLGETFIVNGHFSLLNFNDALRGYVLPLIYHGLQTLISDFAWTSSSMVKLFNALTFALIGTVLGPAFIRTVWPQQPPWGIARRLLLTALLTVFWSGFLNFPLSDLPALAMGLLTLIAIARTDSPGWMLIAGVALAMTIDIRVEYVPLAPVVVALVVWAWLDRRNTRHASVARRCLCAGLLIVGFAVVSLPQSLSAHRYYGIWSFLPDASSTNVAGGFYTPGMSIQGFDGYIGDGNQSTGMSYVYPAGRRLLEEQKEDKITSTSQYIGLFVSHPLVMGGLIASHIVNGLDPLYSTPYIENLHSQWQLWGRILGFLLLFLTLLRLLWPTARRMLGPGRLRYLAALSLCCVTSLPGGIERRYLLPVYLLSYSVALIPHWPNPIASSYGTGLRRFRTAAIIAVALLVYTSVVWYITNDATSHLALGARDPLYGVN
jgi:hypothetical protein